MLQRLKDIYWKLDSGAAVLAGKLKSHDVQLKQLNAAVAAFALGSPGGGADDPGREAAKAGLIGLLAYQANARAEIERLLTLYESALARVAAAEMEIADLREKLNAMEQALNGREQEERS